MNSYAVVRIPALVFGVLTIAMPMRFAHPQVRELHFAQGEIVEAKAYPWSAIGKLNNGIGGSCTAVLISPHYALTAAHCLFFNSAGRFFPPPSLHLILGYENLHFDAHFRVSAYYIPRAYKPLKPYETLASDWSLLSIYAQRQSTNHSSQISLGNNPTAASTLITGGYSQRTPYAMTADRNCSLVARSYDGKLLFNSCKTPLGYSGAPLLVKNVDKHSFSVAGINVANLVFQTSVIAVAIPIEVIWREIKPCIQDHQCQFRFVTIGQNPTEEELLSGLPNLEDRGHFKLSFTSRH